MLSSTRLPLDPAQPQAAEPSPTGLATAGLASAGLAESDGELLRLFTRHGDAAAFERLLERHGEMVWRVCRVTLRRQQDAEDAFQATFLILARSARQIGASDSAAGWLYRVAHRTSLRARKRLARRREEALALDPAAPPEEEFPDLWRRQLAGVLAEELMALPLKYQTPLVMRYLEGQTRRAIAEATDSTIQTVQGRLAQGKRLLRRRMVRRGVTLATAMSALSVKLQPADAASPHVFTQTLSSASALTTGGALAASAAVVSLYREGIRTMLLTSITKPTVAAAACGLAAIALLAPATEPTVQPTGGVVLLAVVAADEAEEVDAVAVELPAGEANEREPEALAPGDSAASKGSSKTLVGVTRAKPLPGDFQEHLQRLSRLPRFERRNDGRIGPDGSPLTTAQYEAVLRDRWQERVDALGDQDLGSPSWEEQDARYQAAKQRYDYLEKLLSNKLQQRAIDSNHLTPAQWVEIEIETDGLMSDLAGAKADALKQERELLARAHAESQVSTEQAASSGVGAPGSGSPRELENPPARPRASQTGGPRPPVPVAPSSRSRVSFDGQQFGEKVRGGNNRVLHEPSAINPAGWATIGHLAIAGEVPILLPGDERPRPSLVVRSGSQDEWLRLKINAPGTARDQEEFSLERNKPRRETIAGQSVEVWHRTIPADAPSSSPYALVIVRQLPEGGEALPPPDASEALELLYDKLGRSRPAETPTEHVPPSDGERRD